MFGVVCEDGEICSDDTVESLDESECCLDFCIDDTGENECQRRDGTCVDEDDGCGADQERRNFDCDSDDEICCVEDRDEVNECEDAGGVCTFDSCDEGFDQTSDDCPDSADVCCKPKPSSPLEIPWYVWLLIVLIILAILGIVFRNKLREILFKKKSGFKEGPGPEPLRPGPGKPSMPPISPMPARMFMPKSKPVRRPRKTKLEKDMQDTLKKLKSMGGKK